VKDQGCNPGTTAKKSGYNYKKNRNKPDCSK